jgi:hypothetical protein
LVGLLQVRLILSLSFVGVVLMVVATEQNVAALLRLGSHHAK